MNPWLIVIIVCTIVLLFLLREYIVFVLTLVIAACVMIYTGRIPGISNLNVREFGEEVKWRMLAGHSLKDIRKEIEEIIEHEDLFKSMTDSLRKKK